MKVNQIEIGGIKELKRYLDQIYFDKSTSYQSKIIGIILILTGIVLLYNNPIILNIKIGVTAILIGTVMIFLITEKNTSMSIDIKITIFITAWILIMFYITGSLNLEIFFIMIFLGVLIIKELTDEFLTIHLKKRLTLLISMFFIIFLIIIGERIISFLGI